MSSSEKKKFQSAVPGGKTEMKELCLSICPGDPKLGGPTSIQTKGALKGPIILFAEVYLCVTFGDLLEVANNNDKDSKLMEKQFYS